MFISFQRAHKDVQKIYIVLAQEFVSENGHVVVQREACQSILGYMFHMTIIWQVYGNVSFSNEDLMAMVKSTAHIVISWDPPLSTARRLRAALTCSSRAVKCSSIICATCAVLTHHPRAVSRYFASAEVQGSISGAIPENVHFETVNLEPWTVNMIWNSLPKAPVAPRTWVLRSNGNGSDIWQSCKNGQWIFFNKSFWSCSISPNYNRNHLGS